MLQEIVSTGPAHDKFARQDGRRLTTFAIVKQQTGTNVRIVGCFHLDQAHCIRPHIKGTIRIRGADHPVVDWQVLEGLEPKTITDESCIVLLNANESLTSFGSALIVDDVSEMLLLAGEQYIGAPL